MRGDIEEQEQSEQKQQSMLDSNITENHGGF